MIKIFKLIIITAFISINSIANNHMISGEVIHVNNNTVQIMVLDIKKVHIGNSVNLYYKTLSGMEMKVGEWKVIKTDNNTVYAKAVDIYMPPKVGFVAKIVISSTVGKIEVTRQNYPEADKSEVTKIEINAFWNNVAKISKMKGDVVAGEATFAMCMGCHMEGGVNMGGIIPPVLDHAGTLYDKNHLIALIKDPAIALKVDHQYVDTMTHPMGSIRVMISDDQQIADVVAYIMAQLISEDKDIDKKIFFDSQQYVDKAKNMADDLYKNSKNYSKAKTKRLWNEVIQNIQKAISMDNAEAYYALALIYEDGYGNIKRDLGKMVYNIRISADKRYAEAQYTLGEMYASGDEVVKDREQAIHWLRMAADQGHQNAKIALDKLLK